LSDDIVGWHHPQSHRSHDFMALLNSRVVRLAAASILAGIAIGVVGGLFRYLLARADQLRDALVYRAHAWPYFGWLAPLVFAAVAAALARVLVIRFAPFAAGSGVQHVEAVMTGEMKLSSPVIVPVKFFGGLLALGSGLALGREGPTVQMGASLGSLVSKSLVHADEDRRVVNAAGAGAGLAVAFNAPIGGSVFVFEELTSSFTPWLLVATLAAASVAVWIMRAMLGNELDFTVKHVGSTQSWLLFPFLALGLLLGGVGALYNASTMAMLRLSDRMAGISSVNRAAFIGGAVGLAAWFAPQLVGSGDSVTQAIFSEHGTVEVLLAVFVLRFLIGPWSYAAAAGRPLRPALSAWRRLWCTVRRNLKPPDAHAGTSSLAFAVVGMSALFSASVRAPLTGVVLTVEMTGRGDLTLALLVASLGAMVVAMLLNSEPIYTSLKRRMLAQQTALVESPPGLTSARIEIH
jgi:chloride channel protein, CIC family